MHHSLKIKILDLDHIESIVEQDITDVETEKIVGGTLSDSLAVLWDNPGNPPGGNPSGAPTIFIPLPTAWLFVQPLDWLNEADLQLQISV